MKVSLYDLNFSKKINNWELFKFINSDNYTHIAFIRKVWHSEYNIYLGCINTLSMLISSINLEFQIIIKSLIDNNYKTKLSTMSHKELKEYVQHIFTSNSSFSY